MSDEFSSAANGWTPGNGMFTVASKDPDWDEITPYTDFDGAQARVSNGVLYLTWTAPTTKATNRTITPLSQICHIDMTDADGGFVLYVTTACPFVPCKKARELAEFIGKHLEQYYENEWRQYFPGHARGICVHG